MQDAGYSAHSQQQNGRGAGLATAAKICTESANLWVKRGAHWWGGHAECMRHCHCAHTTRCYALSKGVGQIEIHRRDALIEYENAALRRAGRQESGRWQGSEGLWTE